MLYTLTNVSNYLYIYIYVLYQRQRSQGKMGSKGILICSSLMKPQEDPNENSDEEEEEEKARSRVDREQCLFLQPQTP